jgi:hypothetical protein
MYHNSEYFWVMRPPTTDLVERLVEACCFLLLAVESNKTKQMAKKYFPKN